MLKSKNIVLFYLLLCPLQVSEEDEQFLLETCSFQSPWVRFTGKDTCFAQLLL